MTTAPEASVVPGPVNVDGPSSSPLVTVHVYADLVCPWCYLGKRRMETALREFVAGGGRASVAYLPFQLDPEASDEPEPVLSALAAKFGGEQQAVATSQHVSEIAATEGLELDFDAAVTANTLRAHRLVHVAGQQDSAVQARLVEALFAAHFEQGLDVADVDVLARVAAEAGLELDVPAYLASDADVAYVEELEGEARAMGISSVPTFVFAGRWGVSGAQEPQTLLTVLQQVSDTLAGVAPQGGGCCGGGGGGCACGG